jgi:acyl-CoA synthetase (AMP-forming)/AMP-acid ligase II
MPNVEAKVVDENGNELGPNEIGELCIRSISFYYLADVRFFNYERILEESRGDKIVSELVEFL